MQLCIYYQRWMIDNYAKFEFEIQLLYTCHESNDDSAYIVSVGKIYSKKKGFKP